MVKGDSQTSGATRIAFCTYGVLLRRLQDDPTLDAIRYKVCTLCVRYNAYTMQNNLVCQNLFILSLALLSFCVTAVR